MVGPLVARRFAENQSESGYFRIDVHTNAVRTDGVHRTVRNWVTSTNNAEYFGDKQNDINNNKNEVDHDGMWKRMRGGGFASEGIYTGK